MTDRPAPKLVYWPFLLVDVLFFAAAGAIIKFGHHPLEILEVYGLIFCVAAGAFAFLIPFRSKLKIIESANVVSAVEQFKNIEHIATQINSATTLWQSMTEEANKATASARQVADKMTTEAQAFAEFIQKANDSEKAHLRLEVEKMKRGEADWLQVLVHMLDHVYAFQHGAQQSGQQRLIEQTARLEAACRDAARRIGLNSFVAQPNELFDAKKHQWVDGESKPADGAAIGRTLAVGYTFQGQLIRPAIVASPAPEADKAAKPAKLEKPPQPQTAELPL